MLLLCILNIIAKAVLILIIVILIMIITNIDISMLMSKPTRVLNMIQSI